MELNYLKKQIVTLQAHVVELDDLKNTMDSLKHPNCIRMQTISHSACDWAS